MSNAADSAGERWRLMVEEEHAQSESVREQGDAPSDSWVPFADRFRPSLDTRDPIVLRLLREVGRSTACWTSAPAEGVLLFPCQCTADRLSQWSPRLAWERSWWRRLSGTGGTT